MQTTRPLLSILLHGRNDAYMGNFQWRISTTINKHAQNIFELNAQKRVEIVFCDWGSEEHLINVISLSDHAKALLRVVIVPPEVARYYNQDSQYSGPHASNTSIRRSLGEYLLYSDADNYITLDSMRIILAILQQGAINGYSLDCNFFWGSRYHVPKVFHSSNPSIEELDHYIDQSWPTFLYSKVSKDKFLGGAGALLMTQKMWHECHGWDERLIYWGWSDIDIHYRLASKYGFGDLEDSRVYFFHLDHYSPDPKTRGYEPEITNRKMNPMRVPTRFVSNDENWGLRDELLPVISWPSLKL